MDRRAGSLRQGFLPGGLRNRVLWVFAVCCIAWMAFSLGATLSRNAGTDYNEAGSDFTSSVQLVEFSEMSEELGVLRKYVKELEANVSKSSQKGNSGSTTSSLSSSQLEALANELDILRKHVKELENSNSASSPTEKVDALPHLEATLDLCGPDFKNLPLSDEEKTLLLSKNYFIALNLHNNEVVTAHLFIEVLRLIQFLGTNRTYVSIYESGSTDSTAVWTEMYALTLKQFKVPFLIRSNKTDVRGSDQNRIDFMAHVRNKAMEPLYNTEKGTFDNVIFINDVFFCMHDVVRLILYESDMACGLDMVWSEKKQKSVFYDTWVARDITGMWWDYTPPFIKFHDPSKERLEHGLAIPVFCCWNGMVVIKAEPFYEGVRFRKGDRVKECEASECSILCKDLWERNYTKIVADPQVRLSYDFKGFTKASQVDWFPNGTTYATMDKNVPYADNAPDTVYCCPLSGTGRAPDGACYNEPMPWVKQAQ